MKDKLFSKEKKNLRLKIDKKLNIYFFLKEWKPIALGC